MAVDFYRANNFIVLPYTPNTNNALIVTFPDLPYKSISKFWEECKKVNVDDFPLIIADDLVDKTSELLKKSNLNTISFDELKIRWQKAQDVILESIYKIIPSKRGQIKKILIHPTAFGTTASFSHSHKNGLFEMYLRHDQGIKTITEAIITTLTRNDIYNKLSGTWSESELLTDWIITESAVAEAINKFSKNDTFNPTLKGTRVKEFAKLTLESDEFYKKLGLKLESKIFGLNGKTPEINKKPIEKLNHSEKLLMELFIKTQIT